MATLKLPQAATVPKISPRVAADPGASAPAQAFETDLGIAAGELLPLSQTLLDAAVRQQNRRETIDRSEAINSKRKDNADLVEKFRLERDLSKKEDLQEFGEILSGRRQDILRDADMTDASREVLGLRLLEVDSEFTAKAAALSTKIGREKLLTTWDDRLKPRLESLRNDPSDENLRVQISLIKEDISDLRGGVSPDEEQLMERQAASEMAHEVFNTLLDTDRIEEAEARFTGIEEGREGFFKGSDLVTADEQSVMGRRINQAKQQKIKADLEIENAEKIAFAKRMGFVKANISLMNEVFTDAGVPGHRLGPNGEQPPAIAEPFGPGVPVSDDFQIMMGTFANARRLFQMQMNEAANGQMAVANFMAKNSPSILKDKELDKMLTEDAASELGVKLGTTLREFLAQTKGGVVPRSPEEKARAKAVATAQGRGEVEAREQIAFFRDGATVIEDVLAEAEVDPTILGFGGSLRSAGKNVIGLLTDFGATALVDRAKDIAFSQSDASLDEIEGWFDPDTLDVLGVIENSVGLIFARSRFGTGRLPVDVINKSIKDVALTGLKSSERVVNRLRFVLKRLDARIGSLEGQFDLGPAEPSVRDLPKLRIENGKLVPAGL